MSKCLARALKSHFQFPHIIFISTDQLATMEIQRFISHFYMTSRPELNVKNSSYETEMQCTRNAWHDVVSVNYFQT